MSDDPDRFWDRLPQLVADANRILNAAQNLRAWQDAEVWWRYERAWRMRRQERNRREPPPPKAPPLPRPFAASSCWSGVGGRDGIARVVVP